tara:strand:+ start:176 stop:433 length:258 start_codon:yes stop_codon:yes gene_type:complete
VLSIPNYPTKTMSIDTSKTVQVYIRTSYGNDHYYVVNDKQAEALEALTKKKTLDRYDFRSLEMLGFTIELVMDPSQSLTGVISNA